MRRLLTRMGRSPVSMVVVFGVSTCACASSTQGGSSSSPSSSPVGVAYTLGHFPDVPTRLFSDSTARALQGVLDAAVKQDGLPGVTATVLVADGGAWSGAAGTADGVQPVKVRSQFAIASITKTVIAAEIMRLSERACCDLSDPVSAHLPASFHFDTNGATIENLLSMESGIPDPDSPPAVEADPRREWTAEELLATVPSYRSTPGDHFVYEDANYMLLGLVIEETTGMSVAAALRSHILADPRLSSMVYQAEERPKGPLALPFEGNSTRTSSRSAGAICPTRQRRVRQVGPEAWQAIRARSLCGDICSSAGISSRSSRCEP